LLFQQFSLSGHEGRGRGAASRKACRVASSKWDATKSKPRGQQRTPSSKDSSVLKILLSTHNRWLLSFEKPVCILRTRNEERGSWIVGILDQKPVVDSGGNPFFPRRWSCAQVRFLEPFKWTQVYKLCSKYHTHTLRYILRSVGNYLRTRTEKKFIVAQAHRKLVSTDRPKLPKKKKRKKIKELDYW